MTVDTTKRNFLGIPIEGDISEATMAKPQKPDEEFFATVQALLSNDLIADFGWKQYTPFFNDGDPCHFSANGLWVRTVHDVKDDDDPEDGPDDTYDYDVDYSTHPTLGGLNYAYDEHGEYVGTYAGEHEEVWNLCRDLNAKVQSGEHDILLQQKFGDHTEIRFRKDRIIQWTYCHD